MLGLIDKAFKKRKVAPARRPKANGKILSECTPHKRRTTNRDPVETYRSLCFAKTLPAAPTGHEGRRAHKVSMSFYLLGPTFLIYMTPPNTRAQIAAAAAAYCQVPQYNMQTCDNS